MAALRRTRPLASGSQPSGRSSPARWRTAGARCAACAPHRPDRDRRRSRTLARRGPAHLRPIRGWPSGPAGTRRTRGRRPSSPRRRSACIPHVEAHYGAWYPHGRARVRSATRSSGWPHGAGVEMRTGAEVAAIATAADRVDGRRARRRQARSRRHRRRQRRRRAPLRATCCPTPRHVAAGCGGPSDRRAASSCWPGSAGRRPASPITTCGSRPRRAAASSTS